MIVVLEIPHQGDPIVWSVATKSQFFERVNQQFYSLSRGTCLYEATTIGDLLYDLGQEGREAFFDSQPDLQGLPEDTGVFRADYLDEGRYTTHAIDPFDACVAFLRHDLHSCHVFESLEEASQAKIRGHQAAKAKATLQQELSRHLITEP